MKKKITISLVIIILIILIISATIIFQKQNKNIEETTPYLLNEKCEIIEKDTKKGMTIKDDYSNEWVWIVVPKTKVFQKAKNETDYENIINDIKEYTKDYSSEEYEDIDIQKEVLTSIYKYGGFWISRYEIGTQEVRKQTEEISEEPISKPNKYVYNNITLNQAKELSSKISNGEYKSNLLYGFQWDLVCKFIEENGQTIDNQKINKQMINMNSTSWGNYYSSKFTINRGKYSYDYGETYTDAKEEETKEAYRNLLFTTGASEQNKMCNIYDFAGNVSEWTLENKKQSKEWCIIRDGSFYFNYGGNDPVNGRYELTSDSKGSSYGFRICIIK